MFDFEKILDSIDRFALHVGNIVVKLGNMLRGLPGSDQVIPRIVGVQKVLVYSKQDRVFSMPMLDQYAFVGTALPSDKTSMYTTQNVFRLQYLDLMRVQCDGIGQIIGVEQ